MTPAPGLVYEESLLALQGPIFGYTPPVNLIAYGSNKHADERTDIIEEAVGQVGDGRDGEYGGLCDAA